MEDESYQEDKKKGVVGSSGCGLIFSAILAYYFWTYFKYNPDIQWQLSRGNNYDTFSNIDNVSCFANPDAPVS